MKSIPWFAAFASLAALPLAAQQYEYPFQNPSISVEQRAANILSLMSWMKRLPPSAVPRWRA